MRTSCLTFGRRRSRRERRPRGSATGARPPVLLKILGWRSVLPDAQRDGVRRGSWHPTPRRSQRRLTPFFRSPLGLLRELAIATRRDSQQPDEGAPHHVDAAESSGRGYLFETPIRAFELAARPLHAHLKHALGPRRPAP